MKRNWLLTLGAAGAGFGLLAFTEARQSQKRCLGVRVQLNTFDGRSFLTKRDVTGYLTNEGANPVVGEPFGSLDFRQLERRLLQHGLVRTCQVSRDLAGNLVVNIEQPKPVARLLETGDAMRPVTGQYISEDGRFFPLSMNYSARVPVISGAFFEKNRSLSATRNRPLLELLTFVQADPFWRAQIAGFSVAADGAVTMHPQVGRQRLELGLPIELETKFRKLKLFYTDIVPLAGWDKYERVNVQYRNQLVCE